MSALREIAKAGAFRLLGNPPALTLRLRAIRRARPLAILSFHRVGPPDGSAYRPMGPALFERLLIWLKRHSSSPPSPASATLRRSRSSSSPSTTALATSSR